MRLIDADELERQEFDGEEACFDYVDAEDIDNAPTVDAEVVVYCKDCKHCKEDAGLEGRGFFCTLWGLCGWHRVQPEGFCSYGERKDGGEGRGMAEIDGGDNDAAD